MDSFDADAFFPTKAEGEGREMHAHTLEVALPGPHQATTKEVDVSALKIGNIDPQKDRIYKMPDDIYLVCPARMPPPEERQEFWIATAWRKDGTFCSTIEAKYDASGRIQKMLYAKIELKGNGRGV